METNVCYGCRFGSVKIEIVVPEKYSLKKFAKQTRDFADQIAEVTKPKPIHYSLRFDSGQDSAKLDFNVNCQCILNVAKRDCSNYSTAGRNCRVKHLKQLKPPTRKSELEIIRTI